MQIQILIFILIWFITATAIIRKNWKEQEESVSFSVIYIANLSLIHFIGALVYLFPGHWYVNGEWMLSGIRQATYGIIAFGIGNLILSKIFISSSRTTQLDNNIEKQDKVLMAKLPKRYFQIGIISYFILPKFLARLPTADALLGAAQQLMIVGICLICWQAWQEKNRNKFRNWIIASFALPFISIILQGFIGFGTTMLLTVLLFCAKFFRPKWKLLFIAAFLSYFGLSFYLTYVRDREELRAAIWGEAPLSISERVRMFKTTLTKPEWFSPFNLSHLERIDERMNQNTLVGAVVNYIEAGNIDYGRGETIRDAFLSLLPRVFWKEKPIYVGGSAVVTKYTGLEFAPGTSIAVGQVMEFYINFGTMGVILGFLIFGIFIALIDIVAGGYLARGDLKKFVLWFLPATSFVTASTFADITSRTGAAVFVAYLLCIKYRDK